MFDRKIIITGTLLSIIVIGSFVVYSIGFGGPPTKSGTSSLPALGMIAGELPSSTRQAIKDDIKAIDTGVDLASVQIVKDSYQKSYYTDNDQAYTVSFALRPYGIEHQYTVLFDSISDEPTGYSGVACQALTSAAATDACPMMDLDGE